MNIGKKNIKKRIKKKWSKKRLKSVPKLALTNNVILLNVPKLPHLQ